MLKKTLLIYNICLLLENMILCETVNSVFLHAESALSLIESLEFEESTTNTSDTKYTTSYIEVKNGLTGSENHHVYTSTPVSMVPEAHLEKLQEQKLEEYVVTPPEQGENKGMKQENLNIETAYHFDGTDDFFKFSNWSLHFSEYFQISFAFIPGNTLKYMQIIVLAHLTNEKYSETGVFLASVTADDTLLVKVALNDSNYEVRQHFWNRSPERHFVQTNLENDQLEVTIDNTTRYASAVKSETSERYKDFKNKALFIGGIPNNTKENINFLSNATNFNGCISNLNIKTTGSDIWPLVDIRNGGKFIQNGLPTLGTCTIFSSASSEEWVSSESDIMAGSTTYDDISENGSTNFTEEEFLTSNMSTTAIPPVITSSNMWPWALLGCTIFTLIMIGCVCLMRKCSSKPSKSNVGAEHQRSVSQVKEEIPLLAREQGGLNRNSMPQNEQNFKRQSRGSNEKDTKQDDILLKSSNKHTEESERTYQSPTILPDALNYNNKESVSHKGLHASSSHAIPDKLNPPICSKVQQSPPILTQSDSKKPSLYSVTLSSMAVLQRPEKIEIPREKLDLVKSTSVPAIVNNRSLKEDILEFPEAFPTCSLNESMGFGESESSFLSIRNPQKRRLDNSFHLPPLERTQTLATKPQLSLKLSKETPKNTTKSEPLLSTSTSSLESWSNMTPWSVRKLVPWHFPSKSNNE